MSPLRWDVLGVGGLLALPLLAMYLRGDLTVEEMTARLPWCLLAGYVVVALLRWASRPRATPTARAEGEPDAVVETSPGA
ncbi:hypothetical protein [Geodermatophilus sp. SYSU D00815]